MKTVGIERVPQKTVERFWSYVNRNGDGCWTWKGSCLKTGYGSFKLASYTMRLAHRVAYAIAHGGLQAGAIVCHRCDNPSCVRPDHLFLGTHQVNSDDMVQKGRHYSRTRPEIVLRGEAHGRARLTVEQVLEIRRRVAANEDRAALAREYGVTRNLIYAIQYRRLWKSIPEED